MYPKLFHETFMEGSPRNELFVCMPFHKSLDKKFETMKNALDDAVKNKNILPELKIKRVDTNQISNDQTHEIFDGILNSRLVLFDLSDDPETSNTNINVMHELGFATSVRAPQSIILIRDEFSKSKSPFNIANLPYISHKNPLEKDWFGKLLIKSLENNKIYNDRIIKNAARSIDEVGFELMREYGIKGEGKDNFGFINCSPQQKLAIFRLMDLHILWFAVEPHGGPGLFWYSCHWTTFGREVMRYLKVIS